MITSRKPLIVALEALIVILERLLSDKIVEHFAIAILSVLTQKGDDSTLHRADISVVMDATYSRW